MRIKYLKLQGAQSRGSLGACLLGLSPYSPCSLNPLPLSLTFPMTWADTALQDVILGELRFHCAHTPACRCLARAHIAVSGVTAAP